MVHMETRTQTTFKRSEHRVTVWAGGRKGTPVSCACGWKEYAFTTMGAYAKKRAHLKENA